MALQPIDLIREPAREQIYVLKNYCSIISVYLLTFFFQFLFSSSDEQKGF